MTVDPSLAPRAGDQQARTGQVDQSGNGGGTDEDGGAVADGTVVEEGDVVDLGGAEMNAEMAIELLEDGRGARVRICNAPLVEGAVIAAVEASGGADLAAVCAAAEELSP